MLLIAWIVVKMLAVSQGAPALLTLIQGNLPVFAGITQANTH